MHDLSANEAPTPATLLHICSKAELLAAESRGEIVTESLSSEGFIHCSFVDQVLIPANERFRGQQDLVLIDLDQTKIDHPIVVEDSYSSGTAFPHVYGAINTSAIRSIMEFPCDSFGTFSLPQEIS